MIDLRFISILMYFTGFFIEPCRGIPASFLYLFKNWKLLKMVKGHLGIQSSRKGGFPPPPQPPKPQKFQTYNIQSKEE